MCILPKTKAGKLLFNLAFTIVYFYNNPKCLVKMLLYTYLGRCPKGYIYISGDIIGATLQGNIMATLQECAEKCNNNTECNSFEHSTTNDVCNLNKEAFPNGPKYGNFVFCSKKGNSNGF